MQMLLQAVLTGAEAEAVERPMYVKGVAQTLAREALEQCHRQCCAVEREKMQRAEGE